MTINVAEEITLTDLNLGLNITAGPRRHQVVVNLISPQGTNVAVVTGLISESFENFDMLLDSEGAGAIQDGTNDQVSVPYYDRIAIPSNSLAAFNGENAMGTWTISICDNAIAGTNFGGTLNRAKLFMQGSVPCNTGSTFLNADYTINDGGTVNTCSGIFADSGNTNSNYGDGENHTMTFCSDQNNRISFTFEHFNTEAGNDILSIYDGNTTGATLIGAYSGFGQANSPGL